MPLPPDFKRFADCCIDITRDDSATKRQIIEFAIGNLTTSQRRGARAYIIELISGRYSPEELNAIWAHTNARVRYENGYLQFLTLAKAMLDKALA